MKDAHCSRGDSAIGRRGRQVPCHPGKNYGKETIVRLNPQSNQLPRFISNPDCQAQHKAELFFILHDVICRKHNHHSIGIILSDEERRKPDKPCHAQDYRMRARGLEPPRASQPNGT